MVVLRTSIKLGPRSTLGGTTSGLAGPLTELVEKQIFQPSHFIVYLLLAGYPASLGRKGVREGGGRLGRRGGEGREGEGGARAKLGFPPALRLLYFLKLYNVFNDNSRSVKFSGITSPIRPPTLRNITSSNVER